MPVGRVKLSHAAGRGKKDFSLTRQAVFQSLFPLFPSVEIPAIGVHLRHLRLERFQFYVAQAFQPAGSGDFPVASFVLINHGTRMSRKPADKNVCATSKL
ncbi:MAG: hypothetical protein ABSG80_16570 [Verrucomicrobiota bacterium]|jgi:hypothetical protein